VCDAAAAAAGWGRLQQQRPHLHVITSKKPKFIRVRPPPLPQYKQSSVAACCASRRQHLRSAGKRQILTAPKFAFLLKLSTTISKSNEIPQSGRTHKDQRCQGAENLKDQS